MAAVPRLWKSLPIDIRSACTTSDFKRQFVSTIILVIHYYSFSANYFSNDSIVIVSRFLSLIYFEIYCNVCNAHLIILIENAQYKC